MPVFKLESYMQNSIQIYPAHSSIRQLYLPNAMGMKTFKCLSKSTHETMSFMHSFTRFLAVTHASLQQAIQQLPLYNASHTFPFSTTVTHIKLQWESICSSHLCLQIKIGLPLQLMCFMCNFVLWLGPWNICQGLIA